MGNAIFTADVSETHSEATPTPAKQSEPAAKVAKVTEAASPVKKSKRVAEVVKPEPVRKKRPRRASAPRNQYMAPDQLAIKRRDRARQRRPPTSNRMPESPPRRRKRAVAREDSGPPSLLT